ncbi:MAG: HNH endonuclease [bacterium]
MKTDWIDIQNDPRHIAKERQKAKGLKKSQWWKNKLAQGICHYCTKFFSKEELTMDHIVPLSRGGMSVKSNIVVSCKECNNKKKYLTPVEILLRSLAVK